MNIKACSICGGRGRIYDAGPDSAGRYLRYYRCEQSHQWKTVEDGFTALTPHQQVKVVHVQDRHSATLRDISAALRSILVSTPSSSSAHRIAARAISIIPN